LPRPWPGLAAPPPAAAERYLRIGRQWGSNDTWAQANQTLNGLATYGTELAKHGFSAADGQRLADARDALQAAGVGRDVAAGSKKLTSTTYVGVLRDGKQVRETARSILENVKTALGDGGDEASVKTIEVVLNQTRSAGADAGELAKHLDLLSGVLEEEAAADRGGPAGVTALTACAAALRTAAQQRAAGPGTPAETETLDLLDGIIVTLARNARKAARPAAKRLVMPSLLTDFELTKLYPPKSGGKTTTSSETRTGQGGETSQGGNSPPGRLDWLIPSPIYGFSPADG
jgi:hypothetical protein